MSTCGANDTVFVNNNVARKGGAIAVGSGGGFGGSTVHFHRCTVDNSSVGAPVEDDPQGEGGAFVFGKGTNILLSECTVTNNYAGKKVCQCVNVGFMGRGGVVCV